MSAFVSLKTETDQLISAGVWTPLRFNMESADTSPGWHLNTPGPNSALITPRVTAVGLMAAMVQWANPTGDPRFDPDGDRAAQVLAFGGTQTSVQFARDPYDPDIDTTGTQDRANSSGADYTTTTWPFTIRNGQPLAVRVWTDAPEGRYVTLSEFKVWVP